MLPLQLPRHQLDELHINADGMSLALPARQLFGAASSVTVARGGTMFLVLPQPAPPTHGMAQLQQKVAAATSAEQRGVALEKMYAYALLEAFRANPSLEATQLGAQRWRVGMSGSATSLSLQSHAFLQTVKATLRSHTGNFGSLQVAAGAPEPAENEAAALVPLHLSQSARGGGWLSRILLHTSIQVSLDASLSIIG